jgi:hypothetical protein
MFRKSYFLWGPVEYSWTYWRIGLKVAGGADLVVGLTQ